jgi:type I restriction-modification system DNA methylase subunit
MENHRSFILEKFQLLVVISLPQAAFAHFGAGVKASIIFVRKRHTDEKSSDNKSIFMAAPEFIGYDTTGRILTLNTERCQHIGFLYNTKMLMINFMFVKNAKEMI